jgi:hypothetical protein
MKNWRAAQGSNHAQTTPSSGTPSGLKNRVSVHSLCRSIPARPGFSASAPRQRQLQQSRCASGSGDSRASFRKWSAPHRTAASAAHQCRRGRLQYRSGAHHEWQPAPFPARAQPCLALPAPDAGEYQRPSCPGAGRRQYEQRIAYALFTQPAEKCQHLQCLAKAHVVGQQHAGSPLPSRAPNSCLIILLLNTNFQFDFPRPPISTGGLKIFHPATGGVTN